MSAAKHADKRQFGRRETALHAVAIVGGRAPAHCTVRNFSERGALLEFNELFVPPFRFRLVIEAKGVDLLCEMRHQGQHGVGVYFVGGSSNGLFESHPNGPAGSALAARAAHEAPAKPAVRTSGSDLRSALFGVHQKQLTPEAVRDYHPDSTTVVRD